MKRIISLILSIVFFATFSIPSMDIDKVLAEANVLSVPQRPMLGNIMVSTNGSHCVKLRGDGTVIAVGDNSYGQCEVGEWFDIVAVSTGSEHTLGLKKDGTVISVGSNNFKECDVSSWNNIVAISAGLNYSLGLKEDGTVVATGVNNYDQCMVKDWKDVVQIAASTSHTVGLKKDGTVIAVGLGEGGECNVGDWRDIIQVSAGYTHTVGLKKDGTVIAVGYSPAFQDEVKSIAQWNDIISISAGYNNTIGLKADGTVLTVGENYFGQLDVYEWKDMLQVDNGTYQTVGINSKGEVLIAGKIKGYEKEWRDVVQISAAYDHVVGLKSDGEILDVGLVGFDQSYIDSFKDIKKVSAGYSHTVGLKNDGTVVAVGDDRLGQCNVSEWKDIVDVAAGYSHTVGLNKDGTVVAKGDNAYGELNVSDWKDIIGISSGYNYTLGLKKDGTVIKTEFVCGSNSGYTQLPAEKWASIMEVSAGYDHYVGLKNDGTVVAEGSNADGECNVEDWKDIVKISAGDRFTLGLMKNGTVVYTGLYKNDDLHRWDGITQIAAGHMFAVGLKDNNTIITSDYKIFGYGLNHNLAIPTPIPDAIESGIPSSEEEVINTGIPTKTPEITSTVTPTPTPEITNILTPTITNEVTNIVSPSPNVKKSRRGIGRDNTNYNNMSKSDLTTTPKEDSTITATIAPISNTTSLSIDQAYEKIRQANSDKAIFSIIESMIKSINSGEKDDYRYIEEVLILSEFGIEKISSTLITSSDGTIDLDKKTIAESCKKAIEAKSYIEKLFIDNGVELSRKLVSIIAFRVDNANEIAVNFYRSVVDEYKSIDGIRIVCKDTGITMMTKSVENQVDSDDKLTVELKIVSDYQIDSKQWQTTSYKSMENTIKVMKTYAVKSLSDCGSDTKRDFGNILKESLKASASENIKKGNIVAKLTFKDSKGNLKEQLKENIKIDIPIIEGDPEYQTVAFSKPGKTTYIGGKFDKAIKSMVARTRSSGEYYIVEDRKTFRDISGCGEEIEKAIEVLASKGIIAGNSDGTYDPNSQIKRSEFATLIVKGLDKLDSYAKANFNDVSERAWYYKYVASASQEGIISGYEDNTFRGEWYIKNQEIVKICASALNSEMGYIYPTNEDRYLDFKDKESLPKWVRKYAALGIREGIIVKREDGTFQGAVPCTRGYAALILYRLYNML